MDSKELYEPIEFVRYEKISDDVISMGRNAVLKFNVNLARYPVNKGDRYFYYKEYAYPNKNGSQSVTIKRTYDYYLTIENYSKQNDAEKAYIRINVGEFILLQRAIDICISWFTDRKYERLFVRSNKGLTMTSPIPSHKIHGLSMNKWIYFEPFIIDRFNSQEPGVRMTLSDDSNVSDITIENLMGIQHVLNGFNMFMAAQNMLASLTPPIGTNRYVIDDGTAANYKIEKENQATNPPILKTSGIIGRKIGGNKTLEDLE